MSVALGPNQRSLARWMVVGVETQSWPRYRDGVTVESPLTVRQCSVTIRGDRKTEAARGQGGTEQNSVFRIGLSSTHEAPATMATCMHLHNSMSAHAPARNWKDL